MSVSAEVPIHDRPLSLYAGIARWCRFRASSNPQFARLSRHFQASLEAEEGRAAARGWQVEQSRWGGRTYRDPRFDALARTVDMGQPVGNYLDAAVVAPVVVR